MIMLGTVRMLLVVYTPQPKSACLVSGMMY